jgi:hypothetical protein
MVGISRRDAEMKKRNTQVVALTARQRLKREAQRHRLEYVGGRAWRHYLHSR